MSGERLPRLSSSEAQRVVNEIPVLRDLFRNKAHNNKPYSPKAYDDITEGFLYSSRFHKLESLIETAKQNANDINNNKLNDLAQEESTNNNYSENVLNQTTHKEQKRKFAIAVASLAIKPYKRLTIVKNGGLATLCDLCLLNDHSIQKCCAITFYLLSKEPNIRMIMIENNIIPSIISLLNISTNNQIKLNCCKALCNLCTEVSSEVKTMRENIIAILSNTLTIYPNMIYIILKIILNLSCVHDKYSRLEEINEIILFLYDIITKKYSNNLTYQLLLLSSLCNLSAIKGNQQKLIEDGCIYILEIVWKSNDTLLLQLGSDIIRNLTTDSRSRLKLLDNYILNNIIHMCNNPIDSIRISAIKSIYILCKDNISRHKLLSNDYIIHVLLLLTQIKYNNIDIPKLIMKIWRILCKDKNFIYQILNNGLIKAFKEMMINHIFELSIYRYCCECICILLSLSYDMLLTNRSTNTVNNYENITISFLIDLGAIDIIFALSNQNISFINHDIHESLINTVIILDTITCDWCSYACYLLSQSSELQPKLIQNGLLPSLINLITMTPQHTSSSTTTSARYQYTSTTSKEKKIRTKSICSAALVNITLLSHIDSSIAIPICINILQKNDIEKLTKINCVTCLYNLAYNDHNCQVMLQDGALLPIVQLTQSVSLSKRKSVLEHSSEYTTNRRKSFLISHNITNEDSNIDKEMEMEALQMKMRCAAILSRLSKYQSYYYLFNSSDVLDMLLLLSNNVSDLITQRRVVTTLSNLSTNRILRKKLLALEPIPYIISLAQKRDEQLWRGCVTLICNLSYEVGSEYYLVNQGIVHTLLITALINTDNILTKIICVKALSNLLAVHDNTNHSTTSLQNNDLSNENKTDNATSDDSVSNNEDNINNDESEKLDTIDTIEKNTNKDLEKSKDGDDYDDDYEDEYNDEFEEETRPNSSSSNKSQTNRTSLTRPNYNSIDSNNQIATALATIQPFTLNSAKQLISINNPIDNNEMDNVNDISDIPLISPRSKKYIYNTMVNEGLIWGISSLALLDDLELLTICAKILLKLSIDYSKEMIASSMTIKAIAKILNYENDSQPILELQRVGSSTLINLLIYTNQSNHNDYSFYNNIVEHMKKIVLSNDNEVIESCILSLCLISQSDKCRKTIVSSGMINLLDTGYQIIEDKDSDIDMNSLSSNTSTLYLTEVDEAEAINISSPKNQLSNIFHNNITSLAYLTMYGNIAKDKILSTNLIDSTTLNRFYLIINTNHRELDFTILRAFYYLSCYQDNIIKLCNSKKYSIVKLLHIIWKHTIDNAKSYQYSNRNTPTYSNNQSKYISSGLDKVLDNNYSLYMEYFVAVIYNLSINISTQDILVSHGMISLIVNIFPYIIEYTNYLIDIYPINKPIKKTLSNLSMINQSGYSGKITITTLPNSPSNINIISNIGIHMKSINLLLNGLCHLGCGNINTNIFCNDIKLSNILNYILTIKSYFKIDKINKSYSMIYINISYTNYLFDPMLYLRCSCTIRNLVINQTNHDNLLQINNENYSKEFLINLINFYDMNIKLFIEDNLPITVSINNNNNNSSPGGPTSSSLPYYLNTYPFVNQSIDPTIYTLEYIINNIKRNCISALKSFSYNSSLHDILISTNAISILLSDMKSLMNDDKEILLNNISNPLLLEVEAESWNNGIRGITKEVRSINIQTSNSYIELIDYNTNIITQVDNHIIDNKISNKNNNIDKNISNNSVLKLHVNIRYIQLDKYQILLHDLLHHSTTDTLNASTIIDLDSKAYINISLKDLDSYDDSLDDNSIAIPKQCPKLLYNESITEKLKIILKNLNNLNISNIDRNTMIIKQISTEIKDHNDDIKIENIIENKYERKMNIVIDTNMSAFDLDYSIDNEEDDEQKILSYLKLIDDDQIITSRPVSNNINILDTTTSNSDKSFDKLPIMSDVPIIITNEINGNYFSQSDSNSLSIYEIQKRKHLLNTKKKEQKFNKLIKLIRNTNISSTNELKTNHVPNDIDKILNEWKKLSGR